MPRKDLVEDESTGEQKTIPRYLKALAGCFHGFIPLPSKKRQVIVEGEEEFNFWRAVASYFEGFFHKPEKPKKKVKKSKEDKTAFNFFKTVLDYFKGFIIFGNNVKTKPTERKYKMSKPIVSKPVIVKPNLPLKKKIIANKIVKVLTNVSKKSKHRLNKKGKLKLAKELAPIIAIVPTIKTAKKVETKQTDKAVKKEISFSKLPTKNNKIEAKKVTSPNYNGKVMIPKVSKKSLVNKTTLKKVDVIKNNKITTKSKKVNKPIEKVAPAIAVVATAMKSTVQDNKKASFKIKNVEPINEKKKEEKEKISVVVEKQNKKTEDKLKDNIKKESIIKDIPIIPIATLAPKKEETSKDKNENIIQKDISKEENIIKKDVIKEDNIVKKDVIKEDNIVKKDVIKEDNVVKKDVIKEDNVENKDIKKEDNKIKDVIVSKGISEEDKKNNVKSFNKRLKEILKNVDELSIKASKVTSYSDLYYYQNEINALLNEVDYLKDNFDKFNFKTENIYDFDAFKLREGKGMVSELSKYIKSKDDAIEDKKKEFLKVKEEPKKEEKPVKKEPVVDETAISQKIAAREIMKQQSKLSKSLKTISDKAVALKYVSERMRQMIQRNYTFGANKLPCESIDKLFNAISLNNELQTMHSLLNDEAFVKYDTLMNEYRNSIDVLRHTYNSYMDSLKQLNLLEMDVRTYDDKETLRYILYTKGIIQNEINMLKLNELLKDKVYEKARH